MSEVSEPGDRRRKVLIADDDPAMLAFLADRCGKMGFDVQTASNGLQALLMAGRCNADVLIIDINMPEVDGLSVCLRLLDRNGKAIEVIVITGGSDEDAEERCESFGGFFARKGQDLWARVEESLLELFPAMAGNAASLRATPFRGKLSARPRVLVVDDDPGIERVLSSRLKKRGVDTLFAGDGIRAFRLACREAPSVILTDHLMENGDAHFLLWRLRTTAATANIPVIVMTERKLDEATAMTLKRDVCGRPGAALVIEKPLNLDDLFETLQRFCAFEPEHGNPPAAAAVQ